MPPFRSIHTISLLLPALGLLLGASVGCNKDTKATAEKEPAPVTSAAPTSSASAASMEKTPEPAPKDVPTFVLEEFKVPEGTPEGVFQIEGAIAVFMGMRVGRIVDDKVEWFAKLPDDPRNTSLTGGSRIRTIHGRYPDSVDVVYTSINDRASAPTLFALTGKGVEHRVADGGGWGEIIGPAIVGDSTVVASDSNVESFKMATTRGPRLKIQPQSPAKAGCKKDEITRDMYGDPKPAVIPRALASNRSGLLMAVGEYCTKRGTAAEIWDKSGKSTIVSLSPWIKEADYGPRIIRGKGDELWIYTGRQEPILRHVNEKFEPLPNPGMGASYIFASDQGQVYANDDHDLYRWEGDAWKLYGHFNWDTYFRSAAADEQGRVWVMTYEGVRRLREGKSTIFTDACATPFVYMYKVNSDNDTKYTFPTTRKALSSFEGAAEIELLEFVDGVRRLGIRVRSKEQGEAVMAHIRATMKDEKPKLICLDPTNPRKIELKPKGK